MNIQQLKVKIDLYRDKHDYANKKKDSELVITLDSIEQLLSSYNPDDIIDVDEDKIGNDCISTEFDKVANNNTPQYDYDLVSWFSKGDNYKLIDDYMYEFGCDSMSQGIISIIACSYCRNLEAKMQDMLNELINL